MWPAADPRIHEHWPLRDAKGNAHAVGIPDQPNPIPVRVRVVWDGDGEEWIDVVARRWTPTSVQLPLREPSGTL